MPVVKKYHSQIVDIQNPIQDLYIITFKSNDKPYKYFPGQFLHLALDDYDPSQPWPESRCFSMQTCEEDMLLKITFSVKGKYTKRMANEMFIGKNVYLKLPYGDLFIKPHNKINTVFIAGGTGVTPFLSLFRSKYFKDYINPTLYLGVRNSNFNIYENELDYAKQNNNSLNIYVINQNIQGMLDIKKIFDKHGNNSTYFISGPPQMIKLFKEFLYNHNTPYDNVRTDDWE